jgi:uncharacterized protein (TIGR02246 family)
MNVSSKFLVVTVALMLTLLGGATWAFARNSATSFTDLTCTAGQIAKFDGAAWACADDLAEMQAELDSMAMKVDPEAEFIATVYAFEDAIKANDADRVSDFYADDAVVLLPGFAPLEGKEALQADWEYVFDTYQVDREAELVYVNVDGDSAVRRMEWTNTLTPKDGGEVIVDTGNCILGFKKVGDEWKVVWDISATYDPMAQ